MDIQPPLRPDAGRPVSAFRWVVGGMLFVAAVLNYLDRQVLALLKGTLETEIGLDNQSYARVYNWFLAAYTLAYLLSGRLVDKWGPRVSMAVFVTWWSLANAATATVRSVPALGVCRALLGLGEAGNWPASAKAVAEWFPARERALAIGLYSCGAAIGATVAPPLVVFMLHHVGWRGAFAVTGAAGLLWVVPWLLIYRTPAAADSSADADADAADATPAPAASSAGPWVTALSMRAVWLLMIARMLTDPVWYFYQAWLPSYLQSERHVTQQGLTWTWVVFLAADVGTIAGGLASAWLLRRGGVPARGRLLAMLPSAALMLVSPLVSGVDSLALSLTFAAVMALAHLAWLSNLSALVVDLMPRHVLATGFGIIAAGSALGGMAMNKVVAGLADRHAYDVWFLAMALLHPVAWGMLYFGGITRRIETNTHGSR